MTVDAKKYHIAIGNQSYVFRSDEPEEIVREAARLVDSLLAQTRGALPSMDEYRIVVLVAMKIALDFIRLKSSKQDDDNFAIHLTERIDNLLMIT